LIQKEDIANWFKGLQDDICQQLESADAGNEFKEDIWERSAGGGGRTRVITGTHIAKGGVNFSEVYGPLPEQAEKSLGIKGDRFYATGISIVLHPTHPWVPIIHMNVRYFEMDENTWWFGGGIDLTPHIIVPSEAKNFHEQLKSTCDLHDVDYYPKFKEWADNYFYLPHRQETRGIGGIFFDRLSADDSFDKASRWSFVQDVGCSFCPLYLPLLQTNKEKETQHNDHAWQMLRRGRYTEFNLVWDRGTKFGLHTNGRTESILMSLPPVAHWQYDADLSKQSPYSDTQAKLRKGIDWLNVEV